MNFGKPLNKTIGSKKTWQITVVVCKTIFNKKNKISLAKSIDSSVNNQISSETSCSGGLEPLIVIQSYQGISTIKPFDHHPFHRLRRVTQFDESGLQTYC